MIKHFFSKQFLGFVAVGGTAAASQWLTRILFSMWVSFPIAIALAYAVGMAIAFTLNSLFVFPKSAKPRHKQARDFILINMGFFPVVWAGALVIASAMHAVGIVRGGQEIAHGIALTLPMAGTFLLYKFFAFKDSQNGR